VFILQINIKTKEEAFAANIDLESINCVKFDSETTNPNKKGSKIRALPLSVRPNPNYLILILVTNFKIEFSHALHYTSFVHDYEYMTVQVIEDSEYT